jgi:hypothetical protein
MKLLLLNDAGCTVASFEDVQRYVHQGPLQALALLDLVEQLLQSLKSVHAGENRAAVESSSPPGSRQASPGAA